MQVSVISTHNSCSERLTLGGAICQASSRNREGDSGSNVNYDTALFADSSMEWSLVGVLGVYTVGNGGVNNKSTIAIGGKGSEEVLRVKLSDVKLLITRLTRTLAESVIF